jgi:hypothetical protein
MEKFVDRNCDLFKLLDEHLYIANKRLFLIRELVLSKDTKLPTPLCKDVLNERIKCNNESCCMYNSHDCNLMPFSRFIGDARKRSTYYNLLIYKDLYTRVYGGIQVLMNQREES